MRTFIAVLFSAAVLLGETLPAGAEPPAAPPAAADAAKYGIYPIAWREIITRWLETQLLDPASAQIEWTSEPKTIEMKGRDGQMFLGYVVDFRVNSRNRFGTYTGKQARRVYIRNGEVAGGGRAKS